MRQGGIYTPGLTDEEVIDQHENNSRWSIIWERNEVRDEHQYFCEKRNGSSSSSTIAFPPSKSYECSYRITPDSEVTRFLESTHDQATWKTCHLVHKDKAERGRIDQHLEKSLSLNSEKNIVEKNINLKNYSFLDIDTFLLINDVQCSAMHNPTLVLFWIKMYLTSSQCLFLMILSHFDENNQWRK